MCVYIEDPLAMMTLRLKIVIDLNSGFSIENGACPVRYVTNYQRITTVNGCASTIIHRNDHRTLIPYLFDSSHVSASLQG